MELHLLLGVVNHLYKSLKNVWPKASQWPAALHIDEEPFHGGHFAGNQSYKLLNNLDLLQRLTEKDSAFQAFGFVETMRKFQVVVSSCFGTKLGSDYSESINQFKASFLALPMCSVTPKVHAVFFHIKQFVEMKRAPLGIFGEQATEAIYHQFSAHWQRYKRSPGHPDYG